MLVMIGALRLQPVKYLTQLDVAGYLENIDIVEDGRTLQV
jgi:hypothetical protein